MTARHKMTVTILYNHDTSLIDSVYLSKSRGLDAARDNRSLTPMTFSVSDSPPTPASIEQEADRLYPNDSRDMTDTMLAEAQRSAHITAARMYMGEVERLRVEVEHWKDEFEAVALTLRELKHKHNINSE